MLIRDATERRAADLAEILAGSPYRAIGSLGVGGMGEVYVVEHRLLSKRFALKVMHRHLVEQRGFVERFRLEARALAQVRHPHVVEIVDFWSTPSGVPCMLMELLEGRTLAAELRRRGRLPPSDALRIACQALAGLEAIHAHGIVHRDVKPENLFLEESSRGTSPRVRILDLGLARFVGWSGGASFEGTAAVHTTTGSVIGSFRYMSPEGRRGERLDRRGDIYSLAVVLYEMLVGEGGAHEPGRPFEPPSVRLARPTLRRIDDILQRALQSDPARRYRTAEDLLADLWAASIDLEPHPGGAP